MVFTKILENITDLFSDQKKEQHKKIQVPLNQLAQGLTYLQNKQLQFNKLNSTSLLLEQFKTDKLDNVSADELEVLENLKTQYDQKLSEYSQSYKIFMESYYNATQDVLSCKADCESKHRPGTSEWSFSRTACKAGCDLQSPYISECKHNYDGSRVNDQKCDTITKGKCSNGNVVLGMDSTVTSINYADSNDVTIKDGCCQCGGGIGGPPTSEINTKKVRDCGDVEKALGYGPGMAQWAVNRCYQARVSSAHTNKNMFIQYAKLTKQNADLIKLAQNIFNKIKELKTIDNTINASIKDEETHLKNQLALYENVYATIQSYDKSKQTTVEGQVEDILLKEKSQSLQMIIWLSLAIITFSLVIHRMRK
jgi:hypothetical protein